LTPVLHLRRSKWEHPYVPCETSQSSIFSGFWLDRDAGWSCLPVGESAFLDLSIGLLHVRLKMDGQVGAMHYCTGICYRGTARSKIKVGPSLLRAVN
jgi:hypothetical protein